MKFQSTLLYIVLLFFSIVTNAQKKDIYFFINSKVFTSSNNVQIDIPSDDIRFKYDRYYFDLMVIDPFENKSLYTLGKKVNILEEKIKTINIEDYFIDKSNYDAHLELCLLNNNSRIYLITNIPNSRMLREKDILKRHMIWQVEYAGTVKTNSIYTNMRGNLLLQD